MGEAEVYIGKTAEYLTKEAVENFNVPVIPKNTVVVSFKLTVGRVAITTEEMLSNEAIAHIKLNDSTKISPELMYLYLNNYDFTSLSSTSSIATAVNSQSIKQMEIIIPKQEIIEGFSFITKPIFRKINNDFFQIKTLSKLRDVLLPKLMKGNVRVEGFNN